MNLLKDLKICFLAGTLGQGGAERQLYYQLLTLKKSGAQPFLLCFSNGEYWQHEIQSIGIPVSVLESRSRLGRLKKVISTLNQIKPKIFQSAHFYTNLYVLFGARALNVHEVATIRSDGIQDVAGTGVLAGRLSMWLPEILAVNSQVAMENLKRLGRSDRGVFYLPNVVDTERFRPGKPKPMDRFHIMMVGRLSVPKRFDIFLRVLSLLQKSYGNWIIGHIVGDGPDRVHLEKMAYELGIGTQQIYFHRTVSHVECFYSFADVILHMSDWEGTPNTILEAMSCGLPVIASRVGGIPDVVLDKKTGFLVDSVNEADLLSALQVLIQERDIRVQMGLAARNYVVQNHSLDTLPYHLVKIYQSVLG